MENGYCIEQSSNKLSDEEFEFLSKHSYATYDVFVDFWKTYGDDPAFAAKVLRTIAPDGVNEERLTRIMFQRAKEGNDPRNTTPHKKLPKKYEEALNAYLRPIVKYLEKYSETEPNNDPLWWSEDGSRTEYFQERFRVKNGLSVHDTFVYLFPIQKAVSRRLIKKDRIRYSDQVVKAIVAKNIGEEVPLREIGKVLTSRFPTYKLSETKLGYLVRSRPEIMRKVIEQLGLPMGEHRIPKKIGTSSKQYIKKVKAPKSKSELAEVEKLVECIQSVNLKVKNKGKMMTRDIFSTFPDLREDLVRLHRKKGKMDRKTFADLLKVHHDTVRRYEKMGSLRSDPSYIEAREERIKIHKEGEAVIDYFNEHGHLPKEATQADPHSITKDQVKEMMDENNAKLLKEISALLSAPQQELDEVNRDNDAHSEDIEDIGHINF